MNDLECSRKTRQDPSSRVPLQCQLAQSKCPIGGVPRVGPSLFLHDQICPCEGDRSLVLGPWREGKMGRTPLVKVGRVVEDTSIDSSCGEFSGARRWGRQELEVQPLQDLESEGTAICKMALTLTDHLTVRREKNVARPARRTEKLNLGSPLLPPNQRHSTVRGRAGMIVRSSTCRRRLPIGRRPP